MEDNKSVETHETCTSTRLDSTPGSRPERINRDVLDEKHKELYGTSVSRNPVVARIQREQTIARDKRSNPRV